MTSTSIFRISPSQNITTVYNEMQEYSIINNPPYVIDTILKRYISHSGRRVRVTIDHASRNVHLELVEDSIRTRVLKTVVHSFQQHRLR